MQQSDLPLKLPIRFAESAGAGYVRVIPQASQIGVTDGAASLTDGFVPLNATAIGAGGVPPDIKDMNGILREITAWTRWQSLGGPVLYDASYSAALPTAGYPKGARIASTSLTGLTWVSTVDNNTTNPDAGGANWIAEGDLGHSYNASNGYITIGQIIVNFGGAALTDASGVIGVTFAKPFYTIVLARGATNDSGAGNPSSWAGTGNVTLSGMTIGMSVSASPGNAGLPANAGTAATWFAIGI